MTAYLCNLIVPGAAKSGTTSLHALLDQHPRITMSKNKEPHFFSMSDRYAEGCERHNAWFAQGDFAFYGEASTSYLIWEPAVERIKRDLANPKIIILLRHPVERLISHYRWMWKLGLERKEILSAVKTDGNDFHPDRRLQGNYKSYVQFSSYAQYVQLWLSEFGHKNVLLIRTEDLSKRQAATMVRCFSFLGLEKVSVVDLVRENATERTARVSFPKVLSACAKLLPKIIRESEGYRASKRRLAQRITRDPPEVSKEHVAALSELLAADIRFFEECV